MFVFGTFLSRYLFHVCNKLAISQFLQAIVINNFTIKHLFTTLPLYTIALCGHSIYKALRLLFSKVFRASLMYKLFKDMMQLYKVILCIFSYPKAFIKYPLKCKKFAIRVTIGASSEHI